MSAFFPSASELVAFGADGGSLFAKFGARGEIGEALEGEELVRGVVALGDEGVGGAEDGFVDFFGGAFLQGDEGVEVGEGEFSLLRGLGAEARVDEVEFVLFVVEAHEGAVGGEVEVESALGTGLADALADGVVGLALEGFGELFEFGFGEGSEGWLKG